MKNVLFFFIALSTMSVLFSREQLAVYSFMVPVDRTVLMISRGMSGKKHTLVLTVPVSQISNTFLKHLRQMSNQRYSIELNRDKDETRIIVSYDPREIMVKYTRKHSPTGEHGVMVYLFSRTLVQKLKDKEPVMVWAA